LENVAGKALRDLDAATRLAVDRTRLAYERTLMAWIRTATTLITFGFTLQKLFQVQETEGVATRVRLLGPHNLALLMIGIGLVALVIATLEHRRDLNALKADYRDIPTSLARVLAALVSVLGILAFISALLRQ
jgi:putative membrane protein